MIPLDYCSFINCPWCWGSTCSERDNWTIISLLSMLFWLTWTIIWKPTAPLVSVRVLFLVSGRMYLKVRVSISKWSGQTFLAVFEDKGLRSALQHGQVVVRRLACLLTCTVSSRGEAVALHLLLWLLSLLWGHVLSLSPKRIITKIPERLSTIDSTIRQI